MTSYRTLHSPLVINKLFLPVKVYVYNSTTKGHFVKVFYLHKNKIIKKSPFFPDLCSRDGHILKSLIQLEIPFLISFTNRASAQSRTFCFLRDTVYRNDWKKSENFKTPSCNHNQTMRFIITTFYRESIHQCSDVDHIMHIIIIITTQFICEYKGYVHYIREHPEYDFQTCYTVKNGVPCTLF